jgi:hypothetical protein
VKRYNSYFSAQYSTKPSTAKPKKKNYATFQNPHLGSYKLQEEQEEIETQFQNYISLKGDI